MTTEEYINQYFQQHMGRNANPDETSYLKTFVDNGHLKPFELGQIIQGLPEAQARNLQTQGQNYSNVLAGQDTNILNKASDQIRSQQFQQGRQDTGAYINAFASAAQNLAMQRQQPIAQFYGQGYSSLFNQPQQMGQQVQNRGYALTDEARKRQYEIEDYYRQQNDFNNALPGQATRNLQGNLVGLGLGAAKPGIGAAMGGGFGGLGGGGMPQGMGNGSNGYFGPNGPGVSAGY